MQNMQCISAKYIERDTYLQGQVGAAHAQLQRVLVGQGEGVLQVHHSSVGRPPVRQVELALL